MAAYTLQLTIFQGSPVRAAAMIRMTPPMAASAAPTVWEMLLKRSPWYMAKPCPRKRSKIPGSDLQGLTPVLALGCQSSRFRLLARRTACRRLARRLGRLVFNDRSDFHRRRLDDFDYRLNRLLGRLFRRCRLARRRARLGLGLRFGDGFQHHFSDRFRHWLGRWCHLDHLDHLGARFTGAIAILAATTAIAARTALGVAVCHHLGHRFSHLVQHFRLLRRRILLDDSRFGLGHRHESLWRGLAAALLILLAAATAIAARITAAAAFAAVALFRRRTGLATGDGLAGGIGVHGSGYGHQAAAAVDIRARFLVAAKFQQTARLRFFQQVAEGAETVIRFAEVRFAALDRFFQHRGPDLAAVAPFGHQRVERFDGHLDRFRLARLVFFLAAHFFVGRALDGGSRAFARVALGGRAAALAHQVIVENEFVAVRHQQVGGRLLDAHADHLLGVFAQFEVRLMHGALETFITVPVAICLLDNDAALEQQAFEDGLDIEFFVICISHAERDVLEVAKHGHAEVFWG